MSTLSTDAKTYPASGAILAGRGVKVGLNADGWAVAIQASSAADPLIGIAEEDAADGDLVSVIRGGAAKSVAGAQLSVGVTRQLTVDANGALVSAIAGDVVVASFDNDKSAGLDDVIDVYVNITKAA